MSKQVEVTIPDDQKFYEHIQSMKAHGATKDELIATRHEFDLQNQRMLKRAKVSMMRAEGAIPMPSPADMIKMYEDRAANVRMNINNYEPEDKTIQVASLVNLIINQDVYGQKTKTNSKVKMLFYRTAYLVLRYPIQIVIDICRFFNEKI